MPIHADYIFVINCTWFALKSIGLSRLQLAFPPIAFLHILAILVCPDIGKYTHGYMVCTWEAGKASVNRVNSWGLMIQMSFCRHPSMPSCWVDIVQRSNGRTSTAERRKIDSSGLGEIPFWVWRGSNFPARTRKKLGKPRFLRFDLGISWKIALDPNPTRSTRTPTSDSFNFCRETRHFRLKLDA